MLEDTSEQSERSSRREAVRQNSSSSLQLFSQASHAKSIRLYTVVNQYLKFRVRGSS